MTIKTSSFLLLLASLLVVPSSALQNSTATALTATRELSLQARPVAGVMQHYRKSGENCFLNKKLYCRATKEQICLFSAQPLTCTVDTVQTIVMDKVLPAMNKVFSAVSGGKLDFIINFADKAIGDVFDNFKNCLSALDGSEPSCGTMNTFKRCAGTASTLLGTAPVMKAIRGLAGNLAKGVAEATNNLGLLTAVAEDQCKNGCKKGDCASEALVYAPPKDCQCTEMFLVSTTGAVFGGYTPKVCAMNMWVFPGVRTASDYARLMIGTPGYKEAFPVVGCFVDLRQTGCKAASQTVFTSALNFVPCVNQLGQTHAISNFEHQVGGLTPAPKAAASKSTVHVHVQVRKAEP